MQEHTSPRMGLNSELKKKGGTFCVTATKDHFRMTRFNPRIKSGSRVDSQGNGNSGYPLNSGILRPMPRNSV